MNKIYKYLAIALCALSLTACGGDDDDDSTGSAAEKNVNANDTQKSDYATRLEMPKILGGTNYLVLAKTTDDIGLNYTVEWDCIHHAQLWTCWQWDSSNSYKNWVRQNWSSGQTFNGYGGMGDPFQPDTEIPEDYRTELADYQNSGYNRGHMCASEDRICSKEVNGQTFYLSNMHPQIYAFNGAVWSNMEAKVRNWRDAVVNNGGTMYVCKGGTIGDVTLDGKTSTGVIGYISDGKVPVPKYFFMAVLKKTSSGVYSAMAFWAEHKADNSTNLTPYMISVDELEKRTGIDFFCNLPDEIENKVEGILTDSEWK